MLNALFIACFARLFSYISDEIFLWHQYAINNSEGKCLQNHYKIEHLHNFPDLSKIYVFTIPKKEI